jgi:hypothetical protein
LERKLSAENLWISEYKPWGDVWASITIKDISAKRALYLFAIRWMCNFPREFRVVVGDKIFAPTQPPVFEPSQNLILFCAVASDKKGETT